MGRFSERMGYKPAKTAIQVGAMDDELRNKLWNAFYLYYFDRLHQPGMYYELVGDELIFFRVLWNNYFKQPFHNIPRSTKDILDTVHAYFFMCKWFEVYDFIEFVANSFHDDAINTLFRSMCNSTLEREVSGYRFIGTTIAPITSSEEVDAIDEALAVTVSLKHVHTHLQQALTLLADRQAPDYRNSIKESISAVETMCNLIAGTNTTLGPALKKVGGLHPALSGAFDKLYGYTSDAQGIRHGLMEEANLALEDAKFMLVACAAFVNYLLVKADKAGINLSGNES